MPNLQNILWYIDIILQLLFRYSILISACLIKSNIQNKNPTYFDICESDVKPDQQQLWYILQLLFHWSILICTCLTYEKTNKHTLIYILQLLFSLKHPNFYLVIKRLFISIKFIILQYQMKEKNGQKQKRKKYCAESQHDTQWLAIRCASL